MSKIISTAHLMGGLGNQMFQISHAICQGWKNNVESKFKPVSYTPMQAHQPTKYQNNIFKKISFTNHIPQTKRVTEMSWNDANVNPVWDKSVEFYGYFQSSKNFLGYDKKIKDVFLPTHEHLTKIQSLYPEIKNSKTVSLHIRRGDYLTISNILPTIDKTYIDECLNRIGNYDTLFVFSDDKLWVKNTLNYEKMIIVDNLEDYEELWMISLCKNNIMSNSSFSWWGSFLNPNDNINVFVPDKWFGPSGEKNYNNIYEPGWTKINVKFENGKLISL